MKRLRRIIFNGLTVLSLVLCLATAAMWVRSYWARNYLFAPSVEFRRAGERYRIYANHGQLGIDNAPQCQYLHEQWKEMYRQTDALRDQDSDAAQSERFQLLKESMRILNDSSNRYWNVGDRRAFPLIVAVTGILPIVILARRMRRALHNQLGLCPVCNYDLRATPDRCPECGTVPTR